MPRLGRVSGLRVAAFLLVVVVGMVGTAQGAGAAGPGPDVSYLNAAHQTNLSIIQASQVAKTHGRACVREVAARLEVDHRRLAAEELEAARKIGVGLVAIPSLAQRQQLSGLAVRTGEPGYDAAWLAFQRQQHHRLLTLANGELENGKGSVVKSVARGTQSVTRMDLRMIEPTCHVVADSQTVPTGDGGQMAGGQQRRLQAALVLLGLGILLLAGKPIRARRHFLGLAAVVTAIALVAAGPPGDAGDVPEAKPPAWTPEREAAIPPVRLTLPGVANTSVVPVAAGSDGQLQVPESQRTVGWWAAGAAPGSAGGTVLLVGHVDSARYGRGVFAPLWDTPVGAKVAVTAGDGDVHRYRIVARRIYKQEKLPTSLFRGTSEPRLALVTCIRSYNREGHRYTHNLVLYGTPTD